MGTRYNDVWITGATGYLGRGVARRFANRGYTVYATATDVDITDLDQVKRFVARNRPEIVINCAGMRRDRVDADNRVDAMRVNALGPRNLAIATAAIDSLLVQISSDDVFARMQERPVDEFDDPHPDTLYGKSKLAGEHAVRELNPRHLIIRSSWLYHADGGRLGEIVAAAAQDRPLAVRADEVAAPTSVRTVAHFVAKAIRKEEYGLFHVVSRGSCTRQQFAQEAYRLLGHDPALVSAAPAEPATAQNVVLDPLMIQMTRLMELPTWQADLAAYFERVGLTGRKEA